jgi:hypothetical protein
VRTEGDRVGLVEVLTYQHFDHCASVPTFSSR